MRSNLPLLLSASATYPSSFNALFLGSDRTWGGCIDSALPPVRYDYDQDSYLVEALTSEEDPVIYTEAMLDIDSQKWVEAMRAEMDSMETNGVWTLVDPPSRVKAIGCK
ncbi:hypothetical protein AWY89_10610 [Pasteurella multocida subsp. multocida]|nr:hypothetical protein AWY89_10610 [Pasteurella multocida subsp. multocida]